MKKTSVLAIVSVVLLILTSCSPQKNYYSTIAMPFSDEEMAEFKLSENVSDSFLENVQTYINENGEKVIYLYSSPVDRSMNKMEEKEQCYVADGSFCKKKFPMNLADNTPIEITSGYDFIKVYLQEEEIEGHFQNRQNSFGLNDETITYENAFEGGEDYICYSTPFGINTEIVIPQRKEGNKYQIKVQLPDLIPDTSSPDYVLFKTALENGEVKSILYTPLLVDKSGNWSYANTVKLIDKDSANNIYTVEYTLDNDFLNNKNTKFPVTMNQSIHLYKPKQPDTSAYENTGEIASHYLSPYILLGNETLKGEGWTYVRFETLNSLDIDPEKIVSAKYVFHNFFDLKKEIKISTYAVKSDWCSINTRWFNRPAFDDKVVSEEIIKNKGDYKLDITSLFIEMIENKGDENAIYSIQNGFMLRCDSANSNVIIPSGDNGLFSPGLEIVLKE